MHQRPDCPQVSRFATAVCRLFHKEEGDTNGVGVVPSHYIAVSTLSVWPSEAALFCTSASFRGHVKLGRLLLLHANLCQGIIPENVNARIFTCSVLHYDWGRVIQQVQRSSGYKTFADLDIVEFPRPVLIVVMLPVTESGCRCKFCDELALRKGCCVISRHTYGHVARRMVARYPVVFLHL